MGSHFRDVGHVRVARIDVHVHRHLVSAFNLSGIPSFVLFPRGRHRAGGLPFTSPRSSAALIQFVTSPAVATLEAEVAAMENEAARLTNENLRLQHAAQLLAMIDARLASLANAGQLPPPPSFRGGSRWASSATPL